jgi:hypothetical protein
MIGGIDSKVLPHLMQNLWVNCRSHPHRAQYSQEAISLHPFRAASW